MKKLLLSLLSVLFLLLAGSVTALDPSSDVNAVERKTKCFVTDEGGFHCEGNPGYEEALRKIGR